MLSDWKNTYFGESITEFETNVYDKAYTVNSSGVAVRELNIDSGLNDGETVQIAMITDSHLTNNDALISKLINSLYCADFADQIILGGDNIESSSNVSDVKLLQQHVFDKYPDAISIFGNHELFYGDAVANRNYLENLWPHDTKYISKLIKNKVLIVALDDNESYFTNDQCDKFEKDIKLARENGYTLLFFHHVRINVLDDSGANKRMKDIIASNGDVIKALFAGHNHKDLVYEISSLYKDSNGNTVSRTIPCYVLEACSNTKRNGNVLYININ